MRPVSQRKQLYYKFAVIVGTDEPPPPLGVVLSEALQRADTATKRKQSLGPDQGSRLWNRPRKLGKFLAGDLLDFTPGDHAPVVTVDDRKEYEIELLAPPGELKEFLQGIMFFGVQDDHVILLQSMALRSNQFETYLNWLLSDATKVLPRLGEGARVILRDQITLPGGHRGRKLTNVDRLTVRTHLAPSHLAPGDQEASAIKRQLRRIAGELFGRDREELLTAISAREALVVEDLEITFEIKRKGRRRELGRSLLDELAETLRHSEEIPFEVHVPDVGTLGPDNLRLGTKASVPTLKGAPVLEGTVRAMHEWLLQLLEDRMVG